MGCASGKDVSKVYPKRLKNNEQFHEFGLKHQNSAEMYDQNMPNGLISKHIVKKIVQRNSQVNLMSLRDIPEIGGASSQEIFTISKDIHDKRTSINTMSAALVERIRAQHDATANYSRPRLSNTVSIQQFVERNSYNHNNMTPDSHQHIQQSSSNSIKNDDQSVNA